MPRIYLDTISDDTVTNWSVYGGAVPAYEAVRRGSSDASGIVSTTPAASARFNIHGGSFPLLGFVSTLTLFCRCRKTVAAAVGGQIRIRLYERSNLLASRNLAVSGSFTWFSIDARIGSLGQRLSSEELQNIRVEVSVLALPASGSLEVSEVYVTEDVVDDIHFYDATRSVLPDAVAGPLQWGTSGTSLAFMDVQMLNINDVSVVDNRTYDYPITPQPRSDYSVRAETRFFVRALPTATGTFYTALGHQDDEASVEVTLFYRNSDGSVHVCLTEAGRDHSDLAAGLGSYMVTNHSDDRPYNLQLLIDRDPNSFAPGKVQVLLDYEVILETYYAELGRVSYAPKLWFGTSVSSTVYMLVDYVGVQSFKARGESFRAWSSLEGLGSTVRPDGTDSQICRLVPLRTIPDVVAGQSNYSCCLVGSDKIPCGIQQSFRMPQVKPTAYRVELEYRDDIAAATPLRVTIQRSNDLFYWDDFLTGWVVGPVFVDLPHSAQRTKVVLTTTLQTDRVDDAVIFTIEYNFSGPAAPPDPHIWIYRVYVAET